MRTSIFMFLMTAGYATALSQMITFVDAATRMPIPGAAIISAYPQASTTTNAAGMADITHFRGSDSIAISHVSYESAVTTYEHLIAAGELALTERVIPFQEITVSARRPSEDRHTMAQFVRTIGPAEMAFSDPQTSADLLAVNSAVFVQKSQLAGGSPLLRGFATNRVLLVVDGVRMNNAIFRTGNLQNVISLDAASVQRAEILFGPGSILYGSDAIGGVMDFTTAETRFSDHGVLLSGNGLVRYSSANSEKTLNATILVALPSFGSLTSFTASSFGDLRAGTHGNQHYLRPKYQQRINGIDTQIANPEPSRQVHSAYRQTSVLQKLRFRPAPSWDIQYAFMYSATSDAPRYDRLTLDDNTDGLLDFAEWYYGPQRWIMNRLTLARSNSTVVYDHMNVTAALQNYEESRHDRRFGNVRRRNQTETVEALSLNVDLTKPAGGMMLFYGVEAVMNNVGSRANRVRLDNGAVEPTNTRYPDGADWNSYGAYVRAKAPLSSMLSLDAGVRYTATTMSAEFDTTLFPLPFRKASDSHGALIGSLGLVFNPNTSLHFFGNVSTGFRSPNIDDIGKVFESEPGSVVVPNPDLTPEYAYNFELGAGYRSAGAVEINTAFYYTLLDNALARRNFTFNGQDSVMYDGQWSRVQALQNIVNAYVYGLQADVKVELGGGFAVSSVYSLQHGEEQSEDSLRYAPLRHAAPAFGRTSLSYRRDRWRFEFWIEYNAGMQFDDLALSERNDASPYARDSNGNPFVPAWTTSNLKASMIVTQHLTFNLGLENIMDRLYRPYASGISAPGRNLIVSIRGML